MRSRAASAARRTTGTTTAIASTSTAIRTSTGELTGPPDARRAPATARGAMMRRRSRWRRRRREDLMFTVFGANGNTGSVVARRLLDSGKKVRLVVRDPDKVGALRSRGAEVAGGDVLDANAVKSALTGAEGAYLLIPPDNTS